jgi:hypothetical protein
LSSHFSITGWTGGEFGSTCGFRADRLIDIAIIEIAAQGVAIHSMIQRTWNEIPYATEQEIWTQEQGI